MMMIMMIEKFWFATLLLASMGGFFLRKTLSRGKCAKVGRTGLSLHHATVLCSMSPHYGTAVKYTVLYLYKVLHCTHRVCFLLLLCFVLSGS